MEVDPYKLLNVPKTFTLEQLKASYKRMMLKHHPDKNFDLSSPVAALLTTAYKKLVEEYAYRLSNKEFMQLKAESKSYGEREPRVPTEKHVRDDDGRFNIKMFNQVFEQNRAKDEGYDDGYEQWMKNERSFQQKNDKNWSVVKRVEPQALTGGKILSNAYELGVDKVNDYSGENASLKNLNYMDYRVAHTTGKIIDESLVKARKEYRSVDELQKDRERIQFTMSDRERSRYERATNADKEREMQRTKIQSLKDQQMHAAYQRAQFALGFR